MATTKIEDVEKIKEKYNFLYPLLSQPDFNIKIAEKREFDDTKYPEEVITDIKKQANFLFISCNCNHFYFYSGSVFDAFFKFKRIS